MPVTHTHTQTQTVAFGISKVTSRDPNDAACGVLDVGIDVV